MFGFFSNFISANHIGLFRRMGIIFHDNITLDGMGFYGIASLKGTRVNGGAGITGILYTNNARLEALDCTGIAYLNNTHVQRDFKIVGLLNANACTMESDVNLVTNRTYVTNSRMKNLFINNTYGYQEAYINLSGTTVEGDINYSGMLPCTIYLRNGSRVTGRVNGANVVDENHLQNGPQNRL